MDKPTNELEKELQGDNNIIESFAKDILRIGNFDSVMIMATKHDPEKNQTWALDTVRGNQHAANGALHEYMLRNNERTRAQIREAEFGGDEE